MSKPTISPYILFLVILLFGGALLGYIDYLIKQNAIKERATRLATVNRAARQEIELGFNNFASFVSGVKAKIDEHDSIPSPQELQTYMVSQVGNLNSIDKFAVSFLNQDHIFQFTFTEKAIDPFDLRGVDVRKIRPNYNARKMDSLMATGEFFSRYLINIVEGWVALPIDFGVVKNGKPLGYMAVLTDFKSIANKIYNPEVEKEFVFRFVTRGGYDLDRERVYDDISIFNPNTDKEFYKNYNVPLSDYIYSNASFYNIDLKIGTAYKEPYKRSWYVSLMLLGWYATLLIFGFLSIRQGFAAKRYATKVREQKENLSRVMASKNKLFSIVAHDLRSPLASIIGLTDLLKEEDFRDQEIKEVVNELDHSSRNTLALLDNLLKWSRVQTGDLTFEPRMTNLKKLVADSTKVSEGAIQAKDLELVVDVPSHINVEVDENMMSTVIRNLINNAIKFSSKGKKIIVSASEVEEKVIVSVEDQGTGMSAEDKETLFDIQVRTSKMGTEGEPGTGLGLLLCKEFMETHNGEIWMKSTLGEGATLYFSLPKRKPNS